MTKGIDFADAASSALDEEATSDPDSRQSERPAQDNLQTDDPEVEGALDALTNAKTEDTDHPNEESGIEVDGETYTLDEIRRLRDKAKNLESDYTKKTQSLAEERQKLADAAALWDQLEQDPLGTVRKLHQRFQSMAPGGNGLDNFKTKQQQLPAVSSDEELARRVDERVKELLENDPRLKDVENRRAEEQLEAVWTEIEHQYDVELTDKDKFLTLKKADELGTYDLPFVFGGLLRQADEIRRQRQNVRSASTAGGTRSDTSTPSPSTGDFSFKDAARSALEELGGEY
jgi:hypothetical protein